MSSPSVAQHHSLVRVFRVSLPAAAAHRAVELDEKQGSLHDKTESQ